MLQALNAGHHGAISTIHASWASQALAHAHCVLATNVGSPHRSAREAIALAIDLVVHVDRKLVAGRLQKPWASRSSCVADRFQLPVVNTLTPHCSGRRSLMPTYRTAVFVLVALALSTLRANAQDGTAVEVTPYVAIGSSGTSLGAAVIFPVTSTLSIETDVAYRRAEGRIHALSTNTSLLWFLPRIGQAIPYLAGGVGLSQYGAPIFSVDGPPIGTESRVALTVNAGGGLKMPVNETLGLRTDVRWFKSFRQGGSEQFRVAQGLSFDVGKR